MIVLLRRILGEEGGGGNDGGGGDGSGLDGQTIVVVIAEMMIEIHMRCRWRVELSERGVVRPTCTVLFTHTHTQSGDPDDSFRNRVHRSQQM